MNMAETVHSDKCYVITDRISYHIIPHLQSQCMFRVMQVCTWSPPSPLESCRIQHIWRFRRNRPSQYAVVGVCKMSTNEDYRYLNISNTTNWVTHSVSPFNVCRPTSTNRLSQSVFTALHGMQTRSCDENSVRPPVRQTRELWQNGRKICLDFYTT